ncbi:hypothetical protein AABB24_032468 [Solanum stoloniferum]|uniref:Uncharacterized protein n=1 Tax=Solanum stoloniferum TaxID=62892 RepID=A0ABD2RJ56_9SOLN
MSRGVCGGWGGSIPIPLYHIHIIIQHICSHRLVVSLLFLNLESASMNKNDKTNKLKMEEEKALHEKEELAKLAKDGLLDPKNERTYERPFQIWCRQVILGYQIRLFSSC